ncbi:uncharacterized protein LOC129233026 [Uloborus diversus]|uniref:uncharacterized protein LOC129233026 n=1 Tax=Uloborus diversus TaxID=327109 RepID=UPI00240A1BDA|nr:uncharacterized protein LOC129233026 [Uloborus diversus]
MSDKKLSTPKPKYDWPESPTFGVKPMSIRGIFESERHRLTDEFTDEERAWRKQWIEDQKLAANEPRPLLPEWEKEFRNPIRRALSKPWQLMEKGMVPILGKTVSSHIRFLVPKFIVLTMATYVTWYHLKYNQNDWTRAYGWQVVMPKKVAFPGDPDYPVKRERFLPSDYNDRGFKDRKVFLDN